MSESLNSFLFSTREMSLVFSPQSQLSAMVRFEWAYVSSGEERPRCPEALRSIWSICLTLNSSTYGHSSATQQMPETLSFRLCAN